MKEKKSEEKRMSRDDQESELQVQYYKSTESGPLPSPGSSVYTLPILYYSPGLFPRASAGIHFASSIDTIMLSWLHVPSSAFAGNTQTFLSPHRQGMKEEEWKKIGNPSSANHINLRPPDR